MRNLKSGCAKILKTILAASSFALLAGCSNVPTAGCEWVRPIYPSKLDTLETKRQILQHNLKHEEFCSKFYSRSGDK